MGEGGEGEGWGLEEPLLIISHAGVIGDDGDTNLRHDENVQLEVEADRIVITFAAIGICKA